MLRHRLITLAFVPAVAACIPPSSPTPGYLTYWVPVYAPPPPYPVYQVGPDSVYQSRAPTPTPDVQFETPSLAVRALAMKISESASNGRCAEARQAGDELERIDADSHHAILAVDERYASCVRGF